MKPIFKVFFLITLIIIACTEVGVVGEEFLPTDVSVRVDTLYIEDAQDIQIPTFSTSTIYLSAGSYQDALFGDYQVESYFLPRLGYAGIDTLDIDSVSMTLRLAVNRSLFYGDTTETIDFGLYYITEGWRAGNMTHNRVLETENEPFVQFTYSGERSITLELPRDYIQNFIKYETLGDSVQFDTYINEFPGVALKPIGEANLIVPFYEDSLRFTVLESPTDSIPSRTNGAFRAAYSAVESNTPAIPSNVSPLRFNWTNTYAFSFFTRLNELGQFNLSAAFLQIDRANELLQSTLPRNHVRPQVTTLRTFIKRKTEIPFSFQGESPNFNINYIDTTEFYLYNMAQINEWKNNFNIDTSLRFYVVPNTEIGILYNTAIFNENNETANRPRVVLTRVEPNEADGQGGTQ